MGPLEPLKNLLKSFLDEKAVDDHFASGDAADWERMITRFGEALMAEAIEMAITESPGRMPNRDRLSQILISLVATKAQEEADKFHKKGDLPDDVARFFAANWKREAPCLAEDALRAFLQHGPSRFPPPPSLAEFQGWVSEWARQNNFDRHPYYLNRPGGLIAIPSEQMMTKREITPENRQDAAQWLANFGIDPTTFGLPKTEAKIKTEAKEPVKTIEKTYQDSPKINFKKPDDKRDDKKIKTEIRPISVDSDEHELPPDYFEHLEGMFTQGEEFAF